MAKRFRPVGVGLFERRKDAGVTQRSPAQCGNVAPTDKKTEKLHSHAHKSSKTRYKARG